MDVSIRALISREEETRDIAYYYLTDDGSPPPAIKLDAILSSHGCELSNADVGDTYRTLSGIVNPYTTVTVVRRVEGSVEGLSHTSFSNWPNMPQSWVMAL